MKKTIHIRSVLYASAILMGCAARASADVYLSEIASFLPGADSPAFVEIVSTGTNHVDLSGWALRDKEDHVFTFPKGTEVRTNCVLVVQFGGSQRLVHGQAAPHLQCDEDWADQAFRGRSNECALFSSTEASPETLVDHVFWGRRPRSVGYADLKWLPLARQLERFRWHGPVYIGNSPAPGDGPALLPSGSIARIRLGSRARAFQDWYVCRTEDVSVGRANTGTSPLPMNPWLGARFSHETNAIRFIWSGIIPSGISYRLQISQDSEFTKLAVDKSTTSRMHDLIVPEGKLFWRVRRETEDNEEAWSETAGFKWRIEPTPEWKRESNK